MVRVWLTQLIRRIAIFAFLIILSLSIGMIWRCYAAEGSPNEQQNIGGDLNINITQVGATITFNMSGTISGLTTTSPASITGSNRARYGIWQLASNQWVRDAEGTTTGVSGAITCTVSNTDNGVTKTVATKSNAFPSLSQNATWPDDANGTTMADLGMDTIDVSEWYHDDTQLISKTRTAHEYEVSVKCDARITYTVYGNIYWRVPVFNNPDLDGSSGLWEYATGRTHPFGNQTFTMFSSSPANLDPPFRRTLASSILYAPGAHVVYTIPEYDTNDYYDDYSLIANPGALSAIHFSGTQGIFALNAGEDEPDCTTQDRLNTQLPVMPQTKFSLEICHTTPAIRAAADLNDEIIHTSPIYIINLTHNRIAGQIPVAIHANDLILTKSWSELNPNVTDHGHGTAGMGGSSSPIAKFVHGDSYPIQQFQMIYWKLNEGDEATAHASFSESDCYADPTHEYPEENDISQQFNNYPTVYFCSPGQTNLSAHISDLDNRHHLIRRWTFNVGTDADGNSQPENADVGETDILSAPGAIPEPTPTPVPSNIFQNIQVFPTPTPAPTKSPFLNVPELTPTPEPPPDTLPGNENYLRQREFTNETPIIESVGAVERNDDDTYKVNVRFTSVEGANRYEIRITQPNSEGNGNVVLHLPVNNPEGTQFTFDTLYTKGRIKIEVRGVAECPAGNVGACVIDTLNDNEYRVNPGATEYSPWSLPYGTAMDFLLSPPIINPDSVNTVANNEAGRYVNSAGNSLTTEVGGLAVNLLGLNTVATRNMGITICAMICLGLATGIYIAAWKGSGSKSALSPVGGFLAVLSLIITWSVLGYIFWELKAGTAALPLAGLLFIGIFKVWNTVKA